MATTSKKRKDANPIKGMGVRELAAKRAGERATSKRTPNPKTKVVTLLAMNPRSPVFVVQWSTDRKKWHDKVTIDDELIVKEVARSLAERKNTYFWRVVKK